MSERQAAVTQSTGREADLNLKYLLLFLRINIERNIHKLENLLLYFTMNTTTGLLE